MTSTYLANRAEIEPAVAALIKKMKGASILHEWYEDYFHMTESALLHPDTDIQGYEFGDILFYAEALVFEITEVGDAAYYLPEFEHLLGLMEGADMVRDRQKMTDEEYTAFLQEGRYIK